MAIEQPRWSVVVAALVLAAAPCPPSDAASLTKGRATVRFHLPVWAEFGLTPNSWIGPAGNDLPVGPSAGEDLLDTEGEGFANPQLYPLNPPGRQLTPDPRRTAPATSFVYDPTSPATLRATANGNIALAGVSRWTVDPDLGGGQLLFGDYALAWNAADGRWELSNYIDFPVATFWIGDPVETTGPGNAFSVSGDLIGSPYLNILLDGALGHDFGDFEFEATAVPEPARVLSLLAGALVLAGPRLYRMARRRPPPPGV